jgi:ribosomal protein S6--L-glutamate ligase
MKISIITDSPNSIAIQSFVREFQKQKIEYNLFDINKLNLFISDSPNGYDRLYYKKGNNYYKLTKDDIGDIVIARIGTKVIYGCRIIQHITDNIGIPSLNSADGILNAKDKFKSLQICSNIGVRCPKTMMVSGQPDFDFIFSTFKLPIVIKINSGSLGIGVSLLDTRKSAISTIQSYIKIGKPFLVQDFINAGRSDIRVIVLGDKVVAAMKRTATKKDEWRANLALKGSGENILLNTEEQRMCIDATKALGLNFVGVDLVRNKKNGLPYLIEVNSNCGFKIENILNVNIAKQVIDYIRNNEHFLSTPMKGINLIELQRQQSLIEENPILLNDDYLRKVFKKANGKEINFINRNNEKKKILITQPNDIVKILAETFKIK